MSDRGTGAGIGNGTNCIVNDGYPHDDKGGGFDSAYDNNFDSNYCNNSNRDQDVREQDASDILGSLRERERGSSAVGKLESASSFFEKIDRDITKTCSSFDAERFIYQGRDVLIQNSFEIPIVAEFSGSKFSIRFSSYPSEIDFGVIFATKGDDSNFNSKSNSNGNSSRSSSSNNTMEDLIIETIKPSSRIQSHINPFTIKFSVKSEGVVVLVWKNNFDWLSNKKISYFIEVLEPAFPICDRLRANYSLDKLQAITASMNKDKAKYKRLSDAIARNEAGLQVEIQEAIAARSKIQSKRYELSQLKLEASKLQISLNSMKKTIPGLGIRCLNRFILRKIFEYLPAAVAGGYPAAALVCRYWAKLIAFKYSSSSSSSDKRNSSSHLSSNYLSSSNSHLNSNISSHGTASSNYSTSNSNSNSNFETPIRSLPLKHKHNSVGISSNNNNINSSISSNNSSYNSNFNSSNINISKLIQYPGVGDIFNLTTFDNIQDESSSVRATKMPAGTPTQVFDNLNSRGNLLRTPTMSPSPSSLSSSLLSASSPTSTSITTSSPSAGISTPEGVASSRRRIYKTGTAAFLHPSKPGNNNISGEGWSSMHGIDRGGGGGGGGGSYISSSSHGSTNITRRNKAHQHAKKGLSQTIFTTTNSQMPMMSLSGGAAAIIPGDGYGNNCKSTVYQHIDSDTTKSTSKSPSVKSTKLDVGRSEYNTSRGDGGSDARNLDQVLPSFLKYISRSVATLEVNMNKKHGIAKEIKQWNSAFKLEYGREPSNKERSVLAQDLYQRYQLESGQYNTCCEKLEDILTTLGLTYDDLEALCLSNPSYSPNFSGNSHGSEEEEEEVGARRMAALDKLRRVPVDTILIMVKDLT